MADGADVESPQESSPASVPLSPAVECLSDCKIEHLNDETSTAPGQVPPLPASTTAPETATKAPTAAADAAAPAGADDDCHPEGRTDSDSDGDEAPSPSGRQSLASYLSRHGLARCELIRVLGKGGFGRCELVRIPPRRDGDEPIIAVRKVLFKRKDGVSRSEVLQQEVRGTQAAKGCDCAVQLLGWSRPRTAKGPHELLLSYVPGVSLSEHLDMLELRRSSKRCNRTLLPVQQIKLLARSVLKAVLHMHNNNMVHGDIRGENVMVDNSGEGVRFVLLDMGVAEPCDDAGVILAGGIGGSWQLAGPEQRDYLLTGVVPPGGLTRAVDLASVGVLIAECVQFHSDHERLSAYMAWEDDMDAWVPEGCRDLCAWLLAPNPCDRPTAQQALEHWWLSE
ncbi:hypothetical protein HYH02_015093 [Chlamydomonas schloesseri]|uniref:Protein kinase domain-containing protein n=1 Tax=Chlamydomonas schloesseri TaxID=2026947 RepID=A0A835SK98_9CHLO|nr:hypothetical protein HYH02_015093 [Chlamydomonas schloesseri]|eukprot:KAG2425043.1 hypothetical protein HYH02_015093 [Chlamydomonas schloesseri]